MQLSGGKNKQMNLENNIIFITIF